MTQRLKILFLNHLSLIIIIIGAISYFLANILLKSVFDEKEYGQYSIIITYFSLIFVFGLMGLEQVFLRFSSANTKGIIETQKTQIHLISVAILLTSSISSFLFYFFYNNFLSYPILLFLSSLCMISMMFFSTVFRLNSQFVLSQFSSSSWKFILVGLAVVFYLIKGFNVDNLFKSLSLGIIFVFFMAIVFFRNNIVLIYNFNSLNNDLIISAVHFFISIASFSIVTFSDRFIIENNVGLEEVGKYFYLCNFFLAPYTILQNYVGFKQLIYFKTKFNINYFVKFNKKILLLGVIIAICLFVLSFLIDYLKILEFKFFSQINLILLLLISGIVRLYSSGINAAFESQTNIKTLRKSNLYIITITIFVLLISIVFCKSVEMILINVTLIWFVRSLIHKKLLLKQLIKNQ